MEQRLIPAVFHNLRPSVNCAGNKSAEPGQKQEDPAQKHLHKPDTKPLRQRKAGDGGIFVLSPIRRVLPSGRRALFSVHCVLSSDRCVLSSGRCVLLSIRHILFSIGGVLLSIRHILFSIGGVLPSIRRLLLPIP